MMFDTRHIVLPNPQPPFTWQSAAPGPALVCRELDRWAAHIFTTRPWALGARTTSANDVSAWGEVAGVLDLRAAALIRAHQVHGRALFVAAPVSQPPDADIILNASPDYAVAVQTADCVPLLIADRVRGVTAAAHAGWRGLASRVPEALVRGMSAEFGSRPADLLVAAGPSIGACCYEVGADVREAFTAGGFSSGDIERWFLSRPVVDPLNPPMPGRTHTARDDHWFFDGWASVRDQLISTGVPAGQIHAAGLCTASHAVFCSYRRDGAPAGRMAAIVRPRGPRP